MKTIQLSNGDVVAVANIFSISDIDPKPEANRDDIPAQRFTFVISGGSVAETLTYKSRGEAELERNLILAEMAALNE